MPKIAFYTLGCKSNQYETDAMARSLAGKGFEIVPYPSLADIYVINTCTVTGNADKKSRHAVRFAKKINPEAKVIATGCYVESGKLKLPEIDVTLKNKDKFDIEDIIRDERREARDAKLPIPSPISHLTPLRVRSNLMIEDGCENFCSYCIVPFVRGKVRSRPINEIMVEAKGMVTSGVKEIVLTGINLGEFKALPSLISHLSSLPGLLRIRLSSIEPQYVTDELIRTIKTNPKVCKHLHIPLQSGDDGILKAMNRNYTAKDFLSLATKIKKQIKDIAITTDIIVGFPGEDDKAFKSTCKVVNKIKFSRIHIFSYSDREGTKAEKIKPKVDTKIIAKRYERLDQLKNKYMAEFARKFKKRPQEVLIEQKNKSGLWEGLTSNYIRAFVKNDDDLLGSIVSATIN
jgi:threonylcarbamoyladenosine tRNA methylthiotransferase MtaB